MRSGIALAGGEGRRMGADKALVPWRGKPLLDWAMAALAECDELIVACGPDAARLERYQEQAQLVSDPGEGPLVALHAAALHARGDVLCVAPCDAPRLEPLHYRALVAALVHADAALASGGERPDPFIAAYRRGPFLRVVGDVLETGGRRSAQHAVARLRVAWVDLPQEAVRDADTPLELERL